MGDIRTRRSALKDGREVVVRSAVPEDASAVLELAFSVLSELEFTVTLPEEYTFSEEEEKRWLGMRLDHPSWLALAAAVEGRLAGFLHLDTESRQRLEHCGVIHLSVHRSFRDQGVGRALILAALDWARSHPRLEKICLAVFADNPRAIHLYESLGFKREGLRERQYKLGPGQYADEALMGLFLK